MFGARDMKCPNQLTNSSGDQVPKLPAHLHFSDIMPLRFQEYLNGPPLQKEYHIVDLEGSSLMKLRSRVEKIQVPSTNPDSIQKGTKRYSFFP